MKPKYKSTETTTFETCALTFKDSAVSPLRRPSAKAGTPRRAAAAVVVLGVIAAITGCGAGGYPGGGIASVSSSAFTIDASQSMDVTATADGGTVSWALGSCSGACGTLSTSTGSKTTYIAPVSLTAPIKVALVASIAGTSSTQTTSITVNPKPVISASVPNGVVGTNYSAWIKASGGTSPLKVSLTSSALPAGLSFDANTGIIAGVPTVSGTWTVTAQVVDASDVSYSATWNQGVTISSSATAQVRVNGTTPSGVVGTPYSATLTADGGQAPYTYSLSYGTLPAGLSLSSAGIVSGTPTTIGNSMFVVQAQDSTGIKGTNSFSINIAPVPLKLTSASLPDGTVNSVYSAPISVSGGTGPYSCAIVSGHLPAGLSLGAGCLVSGTPTSAETDSLVIRASDSSSPTLSATGTVSLTIAPLPLTVAVTSLVDGTVGSPYSATIGLSGGTAPYICSITSGALPSGLSLGAHCDVTGVPSVSGTSHLSIKAVDSSNPSLTATGSVSLTINPAPLALSSGSLPDGVVASLYHATIGISGGTAPYTCSLASGSLPSGLVLASNCAVTGVPLVAGASNFHVKVADASNPQLTTTGSFSITVVPIALSLTSNLLVDGTVGVPYVAPVSIAGGTSPYSCLLVSGKLPAGLNLGANCIITGIPTEPGTVTITAKVSDSTSPLALNLNANVTLTIHPAQSTLTLGTLPDGTVSVAYTGHLLVIGGTAPYACSLVSGALPPGLSLGSDCSVTGAPTVAGSTNFSVKATDASSPQLSATAQVSLKIDAAPVTLTISSMLPDATLSTAYAQTISVSGGTAPYTCTIVSGALPAGLTLGTTCEVTGTPTTSATTTVIVKATDSSSPAASSVGPVSIVIDPLAALTLAGGLPNAVLNVAYTQTLHANGGLPPYSYAITAGSLPAGLTLSSSGEISGTPTAPGASSFTVTATDSQPTPQTANLPLLLLVTYAPTPQDALLTGPYAFLFQGYDEALAGVLAYQTATVGSFTADGVGVLSAGELDSNHQTSLAQGNTITSHAFLGTYTVGTDNRGLLTTTTLHADGTVGVTSTYAIALKDAVPPATIAASGALTEFDNDQLQGTKGSGPLLAQTASAITAGLNGSYAFGLQGDTPCLPTCTVGVLAGPAAAVGQFATDGAGNVTGAQDANISSANFANIALAGTYGAADANGRVLLTLNGTGTPTGVYPTDYAVYVVDANQAFILSTDKHSAYVLLSGTAARQQTNTFSNASFAGAYVGYENAQTNPGLLGATLQSVANLSTATIFRGVGDGTGTCNTTNVDQGGVTALVNNLTGLGSGSNLLNALLGTYQSTGNSSCAMAANGRGVLQYPVPSNLLTATLNLLGLPTNPPSPRVVYMYGPNQGFFLETGYAGLGRIEQQTGSPFSLGTLSGTYVYRSIPAATVLSTTSSGDFTADGLGNGTTDLDMNVGVGTINVLQLGVSGNFHYTLNDTSAGRFVFGSPTVAYAISPSRFVLLDTNVLTTSPSVAVVDNTTSSLVIQ